MIKELLIEARQLIKEEEHWCQCTGFRDVDGYPIDDVAPYDDPNIHSYCLVGAFGKVTGFEYIKNPLFHYFEAQDILWTDLIKFNDRNNHAEVLALLDQFIEECNDSLT